MSHLKNFVDTLMQAQESIDDTILLATSDKINLTQLQNTMDYASVASNNDGLIFVEEIMKTWIRQIEQVMIKNIEFY